MLTHFKTCLYNNDIYMYICDRKMKMSIHQNYTNTASIELLMNFYSLTESFFFFLMEIYFDILHEKRLLSTITMCSKLLNSYWFCRYIHVCTKWKYIWFYRFQVYLHSFFFSCFGNINVYQRNKLIIQISADVKFWFVWLEFERFELWSLCCRQ